MAQDLPCLLLFSEPDRQTWEALSEELNGGLRRVLMLSARRAAISDDLAWRMLKMGASDVLCLDRLARPGEEIAARFKRWQIVDGLLDSPLVRDNLIGYSPSWVLELRRVIEIAHFTQAPVLITGDTGTGKELLARLIHTLDSRPKKGDLVVVDCTTIVPELSGSEFFGHEKGSYTGATTEREGAFALANSGTLFLDEIGELPASLQSQLLRAVQEHTYKRVGGNQWKKTSFRLICATNRNLLELVEQGEFRRDLYYRIAGWISRPPSLSERREDVLPLARHFLKTFLDCDTPPELDAAVCRYLVERNYEGNIRDLRQLIGRMSYHHVGAGPITVGHVPREERPSLAENFWHAGLFDDVIRQAIQCGLGLREVTRATTDAAIRVALAVEGGNLQRAARRLGVTDRALQMRRAEQRVRALSAGAI